MITTTYVTLYQHEQSEEGWATLDPLLEDVAPGHTVDRSLDYRRELAFDSPDDAAALGELLGRQGLVAHVASDSVLELSLIHI